MKQCEVDYWIEKWLVAKVDIYICLSMEKGPPTTQSLVSNSCFQLTGHPMM